MQVKEVQIPMLPPEEFDRKVKALAAEGWGIDAAHPPVAHYRLVKPEAGDAIGASVGFGIDDSKVHVIRGGKIIG